MAVLEVYQADLLKHLDKGRGLSPEEVEELRHTTDLALCATKQTTAAIGRAVAVMVATVRHLSVNLVVIERKEKDCLLDALISQTGLFGTSVEVVIDRFREAKEQSGAFRKFIPRWS